jgi:hypothetical protein
MTVLTIPFRPDFHRPRPTVEGSEKTGFDLLNSLVCFFKPPVDRFEPFVDASKILVEVAFQILVHVAPRFYSFKLSMSIA